MEHTPVSSSNILSIGYDAASETLEVGFTNGTVFQYYNVPGPIYDAFLAADSKGKFHWAYVRNAYPCSRVG